MSVRTFGALMASLLACRPNVAVVRPPDPPSSPALPPGSPEYRVVEIAAGSRHTCARMRDGSVRCWGSNRNGQLGDETEGQYLTPTPIPLFSPARRLALGGTNTCVWRPDSTMRCFGVAEYDPAVDNVSWPSRVLTETLFRDVVEVSLFSTGRCMLHADGRVRCFGENVLGVLGTGHIGHVPRPTEPLDLGVAVEVDGTTLHVCARKPDGTVRCWGRNSFGEVGDGSDESRLTPVTVPGLRDVVQVAVDESRTCAVLGDGTVRCWGRFARGNLPLGSHTPQPVPVLSGVAEVALGSDHGCARMQDGTVRCWGSNEHGQLGDGIARDGADTCQQTYLAYRQRALLDFVCLLEPVPVFSLQDVVALAVGSYHSCALTRDQRLACWGANESGQLGDGTTEDRMLPVEPLW